MSTIEDFKNYIKNEKIGQEDFVDFIDENYESIVSGYNINEIIDFVIYNGENWKLSVILSLNPSLFLEVKDLAKMITISGKINFIDIFESVFWERNFFEVLSMCVKTQNTDFLCKILKKIKLKKENLTNIEFVNINKMFFYACLRNEYKNIKTLIYYGANPTILFDEVDSLSVLKRNKFDKSYNYVSRKYPNYNNSNIVTLMDGEVLEIISDYKKGKRIEDLSYYIAKFGGDFLLKKNNDGENVMQFIIDTGNLKFFLRIFSILDDRSESAFLELVETAKKLKQYKIMNKLIEESVI